MRVRAPRIVGIDVARGLAVLGMFVAHTFPQETDRELIVDGRSAILFATLAGVSLGLLTDGAHPDRAPRRLARRGVAIRALFLFLLGATLTFLPSHIAIILDYYGVMFALMIPVLFLPRIALGAIAVFLAVAAPLAAAWVTDAGRQTGWAGIGADYFLVGNYPALVWLPFLLVGLLCSRSDLLRPRTQHGMMLGGTVAMVVGYGSALVIPFVPVEAHSGSTAEIVGSGGFAITLIGVLLWLERFQVSRFVLQPIAATGSMPLTIYTLQILLLAGCVAFADTAWVPEYPGLPLMFGLIIASVTFSMVWRWLLGAGPLERMLRRLSGFDRTTEGSVPEATIRKP